ncbi:uncharacterized protein DS421_20g685560 [Arachis hypogaea]|uniref:Uncharacterized protein n=1 Tax=Arachis hypogaea TaxID=3818 RepID=A0A444WZF9_ARAHY|nr:uncharacterized protein DS421_20g685560 [Arachis hypogaea]RYQ82844.1 hypothetical protein Ahy_B10g101405 [Arachis hypogaea]
MADGDIKRITITTTVRDTQRLPPRRGQIKIRIFKSIVAALSCSGRNKKQKDSGEGSYYLSSTSTTLPVSSGYLSTSNTGN